MGSKPSKKGTRTLLFSRKKEESLPFSGEECKKKKGKRFLDGKKARKRSQKKKVVKGYTDYPEKKIASPLKLKENPPR